MAPYGKQSATAGQARKVSWRQGQRALKGIWDAGEVDDVPVRPGFILIPTFSIPEAAKLASATPMCNVCDIWRRWLSELLLYWEHQSERWSNQEEWTFPTCYIWVYFAEAEGADDSTDATVDITRRRNATKLPMVSYCIRDDLLEDSSGCSLNNKFVDRVHQRGTVIQISSSVDDFEMQNHYIANRRLTFIKTWQEPNVSLRVRRSMLNI